MFEFLFGGKMDFVFEYGFGFFVLCVKVGMYM